MSCRLLASLGVMLAACGSPEPPPAAPAPAPQLVADTSFDAAGWMERAAVVWDTSYWATAPDSAMAASQRAAAELNEALPWMTACDLPADAASDTTSRAGIMNRYALAAGEDLISISCQLFANQATFVVAHADSTGLRLVEAVQFDETGTPADTSTLFVGLESVDAASRSLTVFTRARGAGDCGTLSTHRVGAHGALTPVSVRARECIDVPEDEVELPERWPVVFPRE